MFCESMSIGCPIGLSHFWQISLLRRAQKAAATTGCPIAFEQMAQVQSLPQRRAQQCEQPCEAVPPLAQEGAEAQQHIDQQCRPDLPAHRVGVVAQEVGQLEGLFEFFEEHFNAPAAAIQIGHCLGAPRQVVGQENHFSQFAVHLDQRDDTAQPDRIDLERGRIGQQDQVIAHDVAVPTVLQPAHDSTLQIVLGAGDPEDFAHRQVSQMREVQIGFVEDHNLARLHASAQFMRPSVVMFAGGVHQGKMRQEGLQVEPHMALRGGFAPAVFGPVQTASHQLNGGRVDDVNQAFETKGKLRTTTGPEAGLELL